MFYGIQILIRRQKIRVKGQTGQLRQDQEVVVKELGGQLHGHVLVVVPDEQAEGWQEPRETRKEHVAEGTGEGVGEDMEEDVEEDVEENVEEDVGD